MFDYINVQCPVPAWMSSIVQWQTKDFDCFLETYEISENGFLKTPRGQSITNIGSIYFYGFPRGTHTELVHVVAHIDHAGRVIDFEKLSRV